MREEARVGQRTTLDVLNAQQELVNARVALVTAQRDRVVASYTLLAAVGRLSPQCSGAKIEVYEPMTHYQQIRDAWGGRAHSRRAVDSTVPARPLVAVAPSMVLIAFVFDMRYSHCAPADSFRSLSTIADHECGSGPRAV